MIAQVHTLGAGRHNDNLAVAAGRISQGATWKKQRICVVIPASDTMSTRVAFSHWNLIFPPNNGVYRHLALGDEVGVAYSQAITDILGEPNLSTWEYILTIEHDNVPPADGILMLIESMDRHPEFAAIGGLYWTKGEAGVPQIWGDPRDPILNFRPQIPLLDQVQECCGLGMGFTLWRMNMFKDLKLRKPWFKTVAGKEGVGTQDLHFWSDARKHGYRCAVDTRVKVGHYDAGTGICW